MPFFRRWTLSTRRFLTSEEVADRLRKAEKALELKYLDQPQAGLTSEQVSAAAQFIAALEHVHEAAAQIGSLIILKHTDADGRNCIVTRSLTLRELRVLELRPYLLQKPSDLLQALEACDEPLLEAKDEGP